MENMLPKWLLVSLGALLVVFVAMLVVQKGMEINTTVANKKPANTITVSGEGKVSAVPDMATVTIGVLSQGATAVDVKNQNNEKVNKVIAYIKEQGVADKDIKTSQFNFYPTQDYNNGTPKITGYQGNQSVTVVFRGVDKDQKVLEKVLDGAVNNGANEINGVNFTIEKPTDLQNEARKLAIADAKKKAEELAKEAGLTLGKVVSLNENGGYPAPIMYSMEGSARSMTMDAKSVAPDIQSGSQEITQTMTVIFEIK